MTKLKAEVVQTKVTPDNISLRKLCSVDFVVKLFLLSLLWMLFTGWQPNSWVVAIPFIVTASILSVYLAPKKSSRINFKYLPYFLVYFVVQSIRGGWDTAKLALNPAQNTLPGLVKFRTHLVNPSDIFTFMQILSLLPGTVSAYQKKGELTIHVLDLNSFNLSEVDECHQYVCKLLNIKANY